MEHPGRPHLATPFRWLLPALALFLAGCDSSDDPSPANEPPTVRLTAGPMDGDSAAYNASFHWYGYDPDGYVARYQYALDVPPELLDDVGDPASTAIPWHDTVELEGRFPFTTPNADSTTGPGGQRIPLPRYSGSHNLFIRAVDNQGAVSEPDYVSFTALNVAPRTLIEGGLYEGTLFPHYFADCNRGLAWAGHDPDAPGPDRRPAYYEWKLWRIDGIWEPGLTAQYIVDTWADGVPWVRAAADSPFAAPAVTSGKAYLFAVRAVDRQGGRETLFYEGRNALFLQVPSNRDTPRLTIRDRWLGELTLQDGETMALSAAVGQTLQLELALEAVGSGRNPPATFEICLDQDSADPPCGDPFDAGTGGRWLSAPLTLTEPGLFNLRLTAVHSCGATTVSRLVLRVVSPTRDRPVLYVDDFRRARSQGVTDAMMDERVRAMLAAAGIPADQIDQWDTFGPADAASDPNVPQLADLAPYRLVVWSVLGSAISRNPALVRAATCQGDRALWGYLKSGGSAWIFGQQTYAGFDLAANTACLANLNYALGDSPTGLIFGPGDFLHEFMKIDGGGFYDIRGNILNDGLARADPTAEARLGGFPPLDVDHVFWTPAGPLPFCDAMFQPMFDVTGGLDTLYAYVAGRVRSAINRKPTAFRYADPDPVPDQGPLAVFGFPVEYLQPGSVESGTGTHAMAATLIDWFRRHERPVGP